VIVGFWLLRSEGTSFAGPSERQPGARGRLFADRLRFRRLSAADLGWSLAGQAAVGLGTLFIMTVLRWWSPDVRMHPPFLAMEPLSAGRYWIFAAWVPFFVLNILSEEFLWRGVVLPRQEQAFGRWAWVVNGAGWFLFHIPFGSTLLLMVVPVVVVIPYVVQRRANTWIGVAIHALLNGPGFVAVALGAT
jgi:membrane protease YdiL (CAAX protease family)